MKKNVIVLLIIINSFIYQNLLSQTVIQYITKGDSAVNINYDYRKGIEYYNLALELDPNNISILNKISKTIVLVADNLPTSLKNIEVEQKFGQGLNDKKKSLDSNEIAGAQIDSYKKAYELASKAIQINPQNAEAYVRRAVANARIAVTKGIFSVANLVNQVKDDLDMAIKLGTGGNDVQAVAHYVLARTHDELSEKWAPARAIIGLGWGNIETALKEYQIAIQLKPDVRMFYLDYAKALIEEDEIEKAKEMLKKVSQCPVLDSQDEKRLKEANTLLSKI